MNSFNSIINKLQNIFHLVGEDTTFLPQIVAVGDLSSGKSSVIESIIGKSFLPKGVGIATRQPLILQVFNIQPEENYMTADYGVFQHKKDTVLNNFDDIRTEIETFTNVKAGTNKEISEEPIFLSIYTQNVFNLTIIDLPGLTKIPVGNQPSDIEKRIRELIGKYISNPNSIIMAIITANTDMAVSESLKLAREFDRDGRRTLAVITKLDLMESGTDGNDILTGKIVPVRLGIVGVVNRSQKDILANKSIDNAIADEAKFLQTHYPKIAANHGRHYLTHTLNKILKNHIEKCLPDMKLRINSLRSQTIDKLQLYGDDVIDSNKTLLSVIASFSAIFCASLDGTSRHIETTSLTGGARICYIFHETFAKVLDYIEPLSGLSKCDILTAIRNASGTRPAIFVSEMCFELLVKRQIAKLLEPSLKCVQLIHDEMQQIIQNSCSTSQYVVERFPKLFQKILNISSDIISRRLIVTNAVIENLINIELAYINTMHPEFRKCVRSLFFKSETDINKVVKVEENNGKSQPISSHFQSLQGDRPDILSLGWFTSLFPVNYISQMRGSTSQNNLKNSIGVENQIISVQLLTERDKLECEAIEKLILNYFNIIKKTIQDKVPKVIMHFLVNFVKDNIERELIQSLYKAEQDESIFHESDHIKVRMEEEKYKLSSLEEVESLLNKLRDTTI